MRIGAFVGLAMMIAACTVASTGPSSGTSGTYGGGGSSPPPAPAATDRASTGAEGGLVNDPSVCISYDDDSANRPLCGVRGGGLDCGANEYSCTGICNAGPVCFARSNCCADSCSAFGASKACGTVGTLNDGNGTKAACDKGFSAKINGFCQDGPDRVCCPGSTSPSYACPAGTRCAAIQGGYCCTTAVGCGGYDELCGDGGKTCCNGLSCGGNGRCRPTGTQCLAAGEKCVRFSTDCCSPYVCTTFGFCGSSTPSQQQ
jgi:hypothetical protein